MELRGDKISELKNKIDLMTVEQDHRDSMWRARFIARAHSFWDFFFGAVFSAIITAAIVSDDYHILLLVGIWAIFYPIYLHDREEI